ncbi:hypothetical protein AAEU32_04130 [Pseudoalteromonas sp. SSDWG2]|uniref:hypothetical protein n=1 Tax=Pseudoalteromonas sp. SSDWG2 TaxID=3139391 RepID=UPI003BAAFE57
MLNNKLNIKIIIKTITAFLLYVTVAGLVLVQMWLPEGVSHQQAMAMAEVDIGLQTQSMFAGLIGCLLVGAMSSGWGTASGYKNTLVCGMLLTLYGVLGVYLHPQHALWAQYIKVLMPLPIVLLMASLLCAWRQGVAKNA